MKIFGVVWIVLAVSVVFCFYCGPADMAAMSATCEEDLITCEGDHVQLAVWQSCGETYGACIKTRDSGDCENCAVARLPSACFSTCR